MACHRLAQGARSGRPEQYLRLEQAARPRHAQGLGVLGVARDGRRVACLGRDDGRRVRESDALGQLKPIYSYFAPTLVAVEGVVLFAGSDLAAESYHTDHGKTMTAFAEATGRKLGEAPHPPAGYRAATGRPKTSW